MVRFIDKFKEKYIIYFFYLFALSSVFSISAMTSILAFFLLIYLIDFKNNIKKTPKDFLIFIFFYLWRFITLIFKGYFLEGISRFFHGMWDKSPYAFCSNIKIDKDKILRFIDILLWANIIVLAYALLQNYLDFPVIFKKLFTSDGERFKGFHSHPLRFAGYYSTVCVIAFSFGLFYSKKYIYMFAVLFLGLLLNGSRTYWFSVVLTFFIISFIKNKKVFFISALILTIYIVSFFAIFKQYTKRVESGVGLSQSGSSISLRKNFWKAGLDIFNKNPILGVGDGKVSDYLKPYLERGEIDNIAHCHNNYITVMAETGIFGLFLLLWIYFHFIKKYFNLFKSFSDDFSKAFSISLLAIFISISLSGLTEHNFGTFLLWGFVSFYMGIYESYYNEKGIKK